MSTASKTTKDKPKKGSASKPRLPFLLNQQHQLN